GLHNYIAQRVSEVAELEESADWADHYRSNSERDAIWRYRSIPVLHLAANLFQVCSLLLWAWLIYPHCDVVLVIGVGSNLLHLLWFLGSAFAKWRSPDCRGPVERWAEELEDCSDSDGESKEETDASGSRQQASQSPSLLPETEDEVTTRLQIETMRQEQESGRAWRASSARRTSRPRVI
ncbi:unnamed protein product, partial [Polarella glacialis]